MLRKEHGYTLVELSISLTLIALLMSGGLAIYSKVTDAKRQRITLERMHRMEKAIEQFIQDNNYIPCPAAGTLRESSASFGVASTYNTSLTGTDISAAAADNSINSTITSFAGIGTGSIVNVSGFVAAGNKGALTVGSKSSANKLIVSGVTLNTEAAGATVTITPHSCNNVTDETGMVPVRTLGLPDYFAYDGWGRKFTYRIAQGMGDSTDFNSGIYNGDISVVDIAGNEKTDINRPPSDNRGAAYVIISHGPNGKGAWYKNNTSTPTAVSSSSPEYQNTDHGSNKRYIQNDPAYYFDDIVTFKQKGHSIAPKKMGKVPFRLPVRACSNARAIVAGGEPASSSSTLLGTFNTTYPAVASQIYASAKTMKILCDNQLPFCSPTPLDVSASNLKLWLDASDPAGDGTQPTDSTTLSTWKDKSGYGNDAVVMSGGTPTFISNGINSRPVVRFNSGDAYSLGKVSDLHTGSQMSFFIVFKPATDVNSWHGIFSTRSSVDRAGSFTIEYGSLNAGSGRFGSSSSGVWQAATGQGVLSVDGLYVVSFIHTATPSHSVYVNGVLQALDVSNPQSYTANTDTKIIGDKLIDYGSYMLADVAEIIIYNTDLSSANRAVIENYLFQKWFAGACY